MSGLNFTREEVYCDHEDATKTYSEELRQDWLAMYDLLVWFKECDEGLPDKGRTVLANQMTDKIRALIGGE